MVVAISPDIRSVKKQCLASIVLVSIIGRVCVADAVDGELVDVAS